MFLTSAMALTDWLLSGVLVRYPNLRICFAEGQIGWIPYVLERADSIWAKEVWAVQQQLPEPPSRYMRQVYGAFFDDRAGLEARDVIGVDQLTFETDYPHQDSTWPHTLDTVAVVRRPARRRRAAQGPARQRGRAAPARALTTRGAPPTPAR